MPQPFSPAACGSHSLCQTVQEGAGLSKPLCPLPRALSLRYSQPAWSGLQESVLHAVCPVFHTRLPSLLLSLAFSVVTTPWEVPSKLPSSPMGHIDHCTVTITQGPRMAFQLLQSFLSLIPHPPRMQSTKEPHMLPRWCCHLCVCWYVTVSNM